MPRMYLGSNLQDNQRNSHEQATSATIPPQPGPVTEASKHQSTCTNGSTTDSASSTQEGTVVTTLPSHELVACEGKRIDGI